MTEGSFHPLTITSKQCFDVLFLFKKNETCNTKSCIYFNSIEISAYWRWNKTLLRVSFLTAWHRVWSTLLSEYQHYINSRVIPRCRANIYFKREHEDKNKNKVSTHVHVIINQDLKSVKFNVFHYSTVW